MGGIKLKYAGSRASILTKHHKEKLLAPKLFEELAINLNHTSEYDTDLLGTFCGQKNRPLPPMEAAKYKAYKALLLTQADIGIGSEGSFSNDPITGLIPWTEEIIYWYDKKNGIELHGLFSGPSFHQMKVCRTIDEVKSWSAGLNFQDQAYMLINKTKLEPRVKKGILSQIELIQAADELFQQDKGCVVDVCFDLRAHHSKKRRHNITLALKELIVKLKCQCPKCDSPGFSIIKNETGLPCRNCKCPTHELLNVHYLCQVCQFTKMTKTNKLYASPINCSNCNP